jgi:serine/threonine protein kinase
MGRDLEQLKSDLVTALQAERWAEALPLLEQFCVRFPEHSKSWLNRGYCLVKLGRHADAVAAFDRCLELEPGSEKAAGWRRQALAALEPAPTRTHGMERAATATAAAVPALGEPTRRAPARSEAPHSFGTMALPDTRRGWQAGTVVDGRYEVREVARGGMAVVAIAFDRELRRMVAIKTPLPSVLSSADGRARFQREAESWIALGLHPNICCAHYLQEIGGMPRLFIEYVDGGDLNNWLKRDPRPALESRLDLAIQIAGGLDYTHTFAWTDDHGIERRGLVHRDIKPANVLLTSDGTARVTDFGLVRAHAAAAEGADDVRELLEPRLPDGGRPQDSVATGSWQTVTAAGGLVGTPPYMAPELWRQAQRGTVASDVYAYGCLLYELFCGRRPFVMAADSASRTREAHLGALMRMHLRDEPPDPRRLDPAIDGGARRADGRLPRQAAGPAPGVLRRAARRPARDLPPGCGPGLPAPRAAAHPAARRLAQQPRRLLRHIGPRGARRRELPRGARGRAGPPRGGLQLERPRVAPRGPHRRRARAPPRRGRGDRRGLGARGPAAGAPAAAARPAHGGPGGARRRGRALGRSPGGAAGARAGAAGGGAVLARARRSGTGPRAAARGRRGEPLRPHGPDRPRRGRRPRRRRRGGGRGARRRPLARPRPARVARGRRRRPPAGAPAGVVGRAPRAGAVPAPGARRAAAGADRRRRARGVGGRGRAAGAPHRARGACAARALDRGGGRARSGVLRERAGGGVRSRRRAPPAQLPAPPGSRDLPRVVARRRAGGERRVRPLPADLEHPKAASASAPCRATRPSSAGWRGTRPGPGS